MVLFEVLRRLARVHHWRLGVAHFNHQLRGRTSDADERFVQTIARRWRIPCWVGRADVRRIARREKVSVEMAARHERHQFLAHTASKGGANTVALAHHADDQVELFFLRLLRGAGTQGLAGMQWSSSSPADPAVHLIRPLLDCRKSDLRQFADEAGVPFREDTSNVSMDILRNRIRRELLPLLARHYQPAMSKIVLRQMEILRAESAFLDRQAAAWREERVPDFDGLEIAIQRRVLQEELIALGAPVEFDLIERLRKAPHRVVTIGPALTVCHDGLGRIQRVESEAISFNDRQVEVDFEQRRGRGQFDGLQWSWGIQETRGSRLPTARSRCECFDADKVGSQAVLRHWQAGDCFQPSGMRSPVKLQDLFTNLRIPRAVRHQLTVATTPGGEIWWVEGLRISEQFKLRAGTRRRLRWSWSRVGAG
jgi:tRNA(Ile)-lysidine synthase